jgi:hypothetical protein
MSDIYVFKVYYGSFHLLYIHGTIYAYLKKLFYQEFDLVVVVVCTWMYIFPLTSDMHPKIS